jgi:hypothetical protein
MVHRFKEPIHTLAHKASEGWNDHLFQVPPELMEKFAKLIVKECIDIIRDEMEDFANGNCFANQELWLNVTREYGNNKERGFDPVGIANHLEQILTEHFGVK